MFSYFENRKTTYFDVFCLNFSIETKIKILFQFHISIYQKNEMALWVHGFIMPQDLLKMANLNEINLLFLMTSLLELYIHNN